MATQKEALLKQYEIIVNSSLQLTSWRQNANSFYLALNTALTTLATYFILYKVLPLPYMIAIVAGLGIAVSIVWKLTIQYFSDLNDIKFGIIHKLEKKLPAKPFTEEWDLFEKRGHMPATQIEKYIPYFFMLLYVIIIISLF